MGAYERRQSWEDLIHDVLLALYRKGSEVEQPAAWVRRATFNAYVDWIRFETVRARKESTLISVHTNELRERPSGQPDDSLVSKEELEDLRRAIDRLPEDLRCVIDAVYPAVPEREPRTLDEAARGLDLPLHTLKNRLRRAIYLLGKEVRRDRCLRKYGTPRTPH